MIPARDGVRLGTNVFLPAKSDTASQRFPAIVERTPYNKDSTDGALIEYYVSHGYAVVIQDVRGRYQSEGRWAGNRDDGPDGSDLLKWIGEQSWSNGKVATMGTSYSGATQHAMAIANAPNLAAMVPVDAMSNPGRYGIRHNGAFELRWLNWILTLGNATGVHATASGTG
jgi:putative CocE/NonD family hydrolase